MSVFVMIFRRDYRTQNIQPSTQDLIAHLNLWRSWLKRLEDKQRLLRRADWIDREGKIVWKDKHQDNGPYMDGKESIGEVLFIWARNYQEAISITQGSPVFFLGGNVEIREEIEAQIKNQYKTVSIRKMGEFILIFRRDYKTASAQPTPEKLQESLTRWQEWFGKLAAEDKLARPIQRLDASGKLVRSGEVVENGPYIELKESIGGLVIIRASSYEEAAEVAKGCPALELGGNVEIRMGN
jgi:hypothetical protein